MVVQATRALVSDVRSEIEPVPCSGPFAAVYCRLGDGARVGVNGDLLRVSDAVSVAAWALGCHVLGLALAYLPSGAVVRPAADEPAEFLQAG